MRACMQPKKGLGFKNRFQGKEEKLWAAINSTFAFSPDVRRERGDKKKGGISKTLLQKMQPERASSASGACFVPMIRPAQKSSISWLSARDCIFNP